MPRWFGGLVLLAAGAVAGGVAVAAKWLLVGRIREGEYPLWSSFVWRNEVADTFVETVAAPWFARAASGHAGDEHVAARTGRHGRPRRLVRNLLAARGGSRHARRRAAPWNRGCVVQTHLFHDRIMCMDTVVLGAGATLGPHGVALPAARLGAGVTVGPASLVVRGDEVPNRHAGKAIRSGHGISPREKSGKKAAA